MRKELFIGLFSGLILLQIATPLSMIIKRELVLKNGMPFRFRTVPVDPYDAFRGRYVALRVEASKAIKPEGVNLKYGQKIYALIDVDEQGFAKISRITAQKPQGAAYLTAKVAYFSGAEVNINLPIDRYYMEEKAAPQAEKIYREHNRTDKKDAYVLVRIKDGFAVIESLYVGDQRIEEVLKNIAPLK